MSAINRATKGARRERTATRRHRLSVLTVAWTISREAAARAWPVQDGDGEVELRWVLDPEAGACRVIIADGDRELPLLEGSARAERQDALLHVHASAGPDEFAATFRADQLLYARTTTLSRAGIAGGRYEVVR